MNNDKHGFHRRSIRIQGYDYSEGGPYFVTVCTQNRKHLFGKIVGDQIQMNEAGCLVKEFWHELPSRFPVELDAFVVMPNHLHGIITLVGAQFIAPEINPEPGAINRAPTLGQVMRAYKAVAARKIHLAGLTGFAWQRNYYEHIIRDEKSLDRIREYIHYNPLRWALDRENPDRQGEDEFDRWLDSYKNLPERNGTFFKGRGMAGHALTEDEGD